jgi:hypothetical protein
VAAHHDRGTLPELTHDLFWLIDQFYSRIMWPYTENEVEDPLGLLRILVLSGRLPDPPLRITLVGLPLPTSRHRSQ